MKNAMCLVIFLSLYSTFGTCQILSPQSVASLSGSGSSALPLSTSGASSVVPANSEAPRAQRYSKRFLPRLYDPVRGKQIALSGHADYENYDYIPVRRSDLIVTGTITSVQTFLNSTQNGAYTVFKCKTQQVLKGSPGSGPLELDRVGGLVKYPDGETRLVGFDNLGLPVNGGKYLLFLKRVEGEPSFQIIAGFSLKSGDIRSLDRAPSYKTFANIEDLLASVRDRLHN